MASYQAKKATDTDPRWSPNWFDPLGRDRRVRRDEAAGEVIEERKSGEGVVVTLVTKNNP